MVPRIGTLFYLLCLFVNINRSIYWMNMFIQKDNTVLIGVKILIVTMIGVVFYTLSLTVLKVKELDFIFSFKSHKKNK